MRTGKKEVIGRWDDVMCRNPVNMCHKVWALQFVAIQWWNDEMMKWWNQQCNPKCVRTTLVNKIASGNVYHQGSLVFGCQIHKQCLKTPQASESFRSPGLFLYLNNCGSNNADPTTRIQQLHFSTIKKNLYSPMVHPPTCRSVRSTGVSVQRSYTCFKRRT